MYICILQSPGTDVWCTTQKRGAVSVCELVKKRSTKSNACNSGGHLPELGHRSSWLDVVQVRPVCTIDTQNIIGSNVVFCVCSMNHNITTQPCVHVSVVNTNDLV